MNERITFPHENKTKEIIKGKFPFSVLSLQTQGGKIFQFVPISIFKLYFQIYHTCKTNKSPDSVQINFSFLLLVMLAEGTEDGEINTRSSTLSIFFSFASFFGLLRKFYRWNKQKRKRKCGGKFIAYFPFSFDFVFHAWFPLSCSRDSNKFEN